MIDWRDKNSAPALLWFWAQSFGICVNIIEDVLQVHWENTNRRFSKVWPGYLKGSSCITLLRHTREGLFHPPSLSFPLFPVCTLTLKPDKIQLAHEQTSTFESSQVPLSLRIYLRREENTFHSAIHAHIYPVIYICLVLVYRERERQSWEDDTTNVVIQRDKEEFFLKFSLLKFTQVEKNNTNIVIFHY